MGHDGMRVKFFWIFFADLFLKFWLRLHPDVKTFQSGRKRQDLKRQLNGYAVS